MNIAELLAMPGAALGCIVGIGLAVLLHWALPNHDLLIPQAIIVFVAAMLGHVPEGSLPRPTKRD